MQSKGGFAIPFFSFLPRFSATLQSISTGNERPRVQHREPPLRPSNPQQEVHSHRWAERQLSTRRCWMSSVWRCRFRGRPLGKCYRAKTDAAILHRGSRDGCSFSAQVVQRLVWQLGRVATRRHFEFRCLLFPLAGFAAGSADESLGCSSKATEQQFSSAGIRAAPLLCKHRLNSAARTSL